MIKREGLFAKQWALRDAAKIRQPELDKKKTKSLFPNNMNQCFIAIDENGAIYTKCFGFESHCPFRTLLDEESDFCYYHEWHSDKQGACLNQDAIDDVLKKIRT